MRDIAGMAEAMHEFTDAQREDFIEEYAVHGTGGFEAILRR